MCTHSYDDGSWLTLHNKNVATYGKIRIFKTSVLKYIIISCLSPVMQINAYSFLNLDASSSMDRNNNEIKFDKIASKLHFKTMTDFNLMKWQLMVIFQVQKINIDFMVSVKIVKPSN